MKCNVGKNIFRLTAFLFAIFILKPDFTEKQHEIQAAEDGIGGGSFSEDIISGQGDAGLLAPLSLESAELESNLLFKSRMLFYDPHTVQKNETISELAVSLGINQDTIISVNKITNTRLVQAGKVIKIPNQDGILHSVKNGDTIDSLAERYKADSTAILTANELFSDTLKTGTDLFIPGARLDWIRLQEINGDLFLWPVAGYITSSYGYRKDPFNVNRNQFHSGMDIKGSAGTPVRTAMAGRVSRVGFDNIMGNFVIISHHSGYRTLYGHMSVISTKTGAYVAAGERIGDIGSTGLSTGPHLHFTVYKNGVTVNPSTLLK
jgi:murein DD-endopeptidase MepM/ murein hydrolase activator NlpD